VSSGGFIWGSLIGVVVAVLVLIMVGKKALCGHTCPEHLLAGDEVGNCYFCVKMALGIMQCTPLRISTIGEATIADDRSE